MHYSCNYCNFPLPLPRPWQYTISRRTIYYLHLPDILYCHGQHKVNNSLTRKNARDYAVLEEIIQQGTRAKDLAKISTVSNSDVQAVLGDIAGVMHTRMAQGKSVHIKGLGYFRYVLDTTGVENLEDFDFQKQVKAVRVEFIPERTRTSGGTYTRALVDSDQLEWIELAPNTEEQDPAEDDDDEGQTENPLG